MRWNVFLQKNFGSCSLVFQWGIVFSLGSVCVRVMNVASVFSFNEKIKHLQRLISHSKLIQLDSRRLKTKYYQSELYQITATDLHNEAVYYKAVYFQQG